MEAKSKILKLAIFLLISLFFTGCSAEESSENSADGSSDGKVAVADWGNGGQTLQSRSRLVGDTLYYVYGKWDEEKQQEYDTVVYRMQEGTEPEEVVRLEEEQLIAYSVDRSESVYLLCRETSSEKTEFCLRKYSGEGELVYDTAVNPDEMPEISGLESVCSCEADEAGNLCLMNTSGDIYIWDALGRLAYRKEKTAEGDMWTGFVNAGKEVVYAYQIKGRKLILKKCNPAEGNLEEESEVALPEESGATLEVFSGYDNGVLIADSDFLWIYDIENEKLSRLLSWGDSTVNLKDYLHEAVGIAPDETVWVYANRSYEDAVLVRITQKNSEEVKEKQTVTLALLEAEEGSNQEEYNLTLTEMVNAFNRTNSEYSVECVTYPSVLELHTAIIKGKGPDIFDFCYGRLEICTLAGKGVLENLSPYFEQSDVIREEELLSSVRRAGTIDGELVCIFPSFTVEGFAVNGTSGFQDGWTVEQYLELGQAHPEAALFDYDQPDFYQNGILRIVLAADMERYIDWEERQCYFDREYFISVLERINRLPVPDTPLIEDMAALFRERGVGAVFEVIDEKMASGELLTRSFQGSSMESFNSWKEDGYFGSDTAVFMGYPNQEGKPYYKMSCETPLAMNSASGNKEGAWAFLEFLLSEEYQNTRIDTGFPVRQDSFERHMARTEIYGGWVELVLTEEDKESVRNIVENAYWTDAFSTFELIMIIQEEAQSVWAGDKTPEEAAEIIQGRLEIYVSEQ